MAPQKCNFCHHESKIIRCLGASKYFFHVLKMYSTFFETTLIPKDDCMKNFLYAILLLFVFLFNASSMLFQFQYLKMSHFYSIPAYHPTSRTACGGEADYGVKAGAWA